MSIQHILYYLSAELLAQISPMLDINKNPVYFFIFVTWYSLIFWTVLVIFTNTFGSKSLNHGGIHEVRQKKAETTRALGWALGPPLRPPLRPSGPTGCKASHSTRNPPVSMKPPQVSSSYSKKHVKPQIFVRVSLKPSTKKKGGFPLKLQFLQNLVSLEG